jgi:hypothetical protein
MSDKGRAIATFSWKPGEEALSTLQVAGMEARLDFAHSLLVLASRLNLVIRDGMPTPNSGLLYYEDVAHLVSGGRLPAFLVDLAYEHGTNGGKEARFASYRALWVAEKGS